LAESEQAVREPLHFLAAVLEHQHFRSLDPVVVEAASFEPDPTTVDDEVGLVVDRLGPLAPRAEDPEDFFHQVAVAPLLELAAARLEPPRPEHWQGRQCPFCTGDPKVSVIVEESGEFMAGAPRYLICGRCATPWVHARAICPSCGENDPKQLDVYNNERWPWARIDACQTCGSYIKTFDLRVPGSSAVVPLVDEVATLSLDLWATGSELQL
jgi:formate dehydrogenase maturation protein FdhE